MKTPQDAMLAMNRITKWRVLFTGWQLGTRPKGDPEGDAVRDAREMLIALRVENTALTGLLIRKGVISAAEYADAVATEADLLNADYEKRFPGVTAGQDGLHFTSEAHAWMQHWKP